MQEKTIITAMYDRVDQARSAISELHSLGVPQENISMIASDAAGEYSKFHGREFPQDTDTAGDAAEGAATGAVIGGLGGLVVGLAALAIPGIGPILAAGPIASALVAGGIGAGVGAVAGGMVGALVDLGLSEEEAGYYAEGVRRGGTLVTVQTPDHLSGRVMDVLDRHDAVDVEERASNWRQSGWTGYDPSAKPYSVDQIERERSQFGSHSSMRR